MHKVNQFSLYLGKAFVQFHKEVQHGTELLSPGSGSITKSSGLFPSFALSLALSYIQI